MKKIIYITRSYLPDKSGGILMRVATVDLLKKNGYEVEVFTPNYSDNQVKRKNGITYFPIVNSRLNVIKQRLGLIEDYMDEWVESAYAYLKEEIDGDDIIFATSGGELGTIKLGVKLKNFLGCKLLINLRDPIDYTRVNGKVLDRKIHVNRDKIEKKYFLQADFIVTSSESNSNSLKDKYPEFSDKIINNYFGYIKKVELNTELNFKKNKIKIFYGGIFGSLQKPEMIIPWIPSNAEVHFIGNYRNYREISKYRTSEGVVFHEEMSHTDFLEFVQSEMDVAYLPLSDDYLGACVPSKLYEYINLGKPIIGILPYGDAFDIINNNQYGIAIHYKETNKIKSCLEKISQEENYLMYRKNILKDKENWGMEVRIKELVDIIKRIEMIE